MGMFDQPSTTSVESPDFGQEETEAEVTETQEEQFEDEQFEDQEVELEEEEETEETEEVEDSEDSEEEQSEELIGGKFKSVDDLLKSYNSLQSQFTKQRQQEKAQQQPTQPMDQQNPVDLFYEAFNNDPLGTINYIVSQAVQQQTAPLIEQRQAEQFNRNFEPIAKQYQAQLSEEGGIEAYQQKIIELAEEFGNPNLARNPSPRMMKLAAQELWGESTAALVNKAKSETRKQIEQNRRIKQQVNVKSSKKPKQANKTAEDQIREAIMNAGHVGGMFQR